MHCIITIAIRFQESNVATTAGAKFNPIENLVPIDLEGKNFSIWNFRNSHNGDGRPIVL